MSEAYRKAEPRFDIDLKWGHEAERKIRKLFRCFASSDPRVEVKRKRYLDLKFYIETHCDKGRHGEYAPSGISVTTAELWAFVIDESGVYVLIPTNLLREVIAEAACEDKEERDGDCPTRGKLVDFSVLMYRLKQQRERARASLEPLKPSTFERVAPITADDMRWT